MSKELAGIGVLKVRVRRDRTGYRTNESNLSIKGSEYKSKSRIGETGGINNGEEGETYRNIK